MMSIIEVALLINLIIIIALLLVTFELGDKIALLRRAHELLEQEVREKKE